MTLCQYCICYGAFLSPHAETMAQINAHVTKLISVAPLDVTRDMPNALSRKALQRSSRKSLPVIIIRLAVF